MTRIRRLTQTGERTRADSRGHRRGRSRGTPEQTAARGQDTGSGTDDLAEKN